MAFDVHSLGGSRSVAAFKQPQVNCLNRLNATTLVNMIYIQRDGDANSLAVRKMADMVLIAQVCQI